MRIVGRATDVHSRGGLSHLLELGDGDRVRAVRSEPPTGITRLGHGWGVRSW